MQSLRNQVLKLTLFHSLRSKSMQLWKRFLALSQFQPRKRRVRWRHWRNSTSPICWVKLNSSANQPFRKLRRRGRLGQTFSVASLTKKACWLLVSSAQGSSNSRKETYLLSLQMTSSPGSNKLFRQKQRVSLRLSISIYSPTWLRLTKKSLALRTSSRNSNQSPQAKPLSALLNGSRIQFVIWRRKRWQDSYLKIGRPSQSCELYLIKSQGEN